MTFGTRTRLLYSRVFDGASSPERIVSELQEGNKIRWAEFGRKFISLLGQELDRRIARRGFVGILESDSIIGSALLSVLQTPDYAGQQNRETIAIQFVQDIKRAVDRKFDTKRKRVLRRKTKIEYKPVTEHADSGLSPEATTMFDEVIERIRSYDPELVDVISYESDLYFKDGRRKGYFNINAIARSLNISRYYASDRLARLIQRAKNELTVDLCEWTNG